MRHRYKIAMILQKKPCGKRHLAEMVRLLGVGWHLLPGCFPGALG